LARLAEAANALAPGLATQPLPETGSTEVAQAAAAFNAMQRRIDGHLAERMRILAAVSHDLQSPITRMRLRVDLLDDAELREKLHGDLAAMQSLVGEGLAYARSAHSGVEAPRALDLHALLDSLACDYADAGQMVAFAGCAGLILRTRPQTLRRVLINLVDNALKFAGEVEMAVHLTSDDRICIDVLDRGPGIAQSELQAVLQPFYRLEGSRSRDTGGTGLGLAIAQQLSQVLGGELALSNRSGGGLQARLRLPLR
jgi:signal transduction histidine kinase